MLLALAQSPTAYLVAVLLGTLLGSFANVCIVRIPLEKSIVRPGSHCFACGAPVKWYDNVPIVSYLLLRGRCRACGGHYSARYLLIEAATGLLVGAVYALVFIGARSDDDVPACMAHFGAYALFVVALVIIAFIDLDHKQIPDAITIPGIPLLFAVAVLLGDRPATELVLGIFASYGVVGLIGDAWYFLTGRDALGLGDAKLLSFVGALLGWRASLFALFGGALVGTILLVPVLLVRRLRRGRGDVLRFETPYGPFLVTAAIVFLFLQSRLQLEFARILP